MEIKLGTTVITLVDKDDIEFLDTHTHVPKGTIGSVCDIENILDGFVIVQFNLNDIDGDGTGVIPYDLDEIEVYDK